MAMTRLHSTRTLLLALFCGAPIAMAQASIINESSSASGEQVSLTLTPTIGGMVTINSGPLPITSGNGSSPYQSSNSALSASIANVLNTGLLTVDASGVFNGNSGTAASDSTVNGLNLALTNILGINASTVETTAAAQGVYSALSATGMTTIEGLSVAGLAPFGASIIPGVNDVILNALGVTVTLNKQVVTGNGTTNAGITVDGIDVSFSNVLATIGGTTGLLNGSIDIANSVANIVASPAAVPEPASIALLAGSLGLMGLLTRKRTIA